VKLKSTRITISKEGYKLADKKAHNRGLANKPTAPDEEEEL
jgi:hypothetical protein